MRNEKTREFNSYHTDRKFHLCTARQYLIWSVSPTYSLYISFFFQATKNIHLLMIMIRDKGGEHTKMRNKKMKIKGIVSDTETLLLFQVTENSKCTMKKKEKRR